MSKFTKNNFCKIIQEIESMKEQDENIWVPVGILEVMYDDDKGYIDSYFYSQTKKEYKHREALWELLHGNMFLNKINFDK